LIKAHQLIPVSAKTVFVLGTKGTFRLHIVGVLKQEKGDYIEAIEYFREAINRDENNPEPYHKLAEIFLSKRELDKAIFYASECSKFKQSDADLNNLIGLCYLQKVIPKEYLNKPRRIICKKPKNTYRQLIYSMQTILEF